MTDLTCSACSGPIVQKEHGPLGNCGSCGGLHTIRPVHKGALPINLFRMVADVPLEDARYFDLEYWDNRTREIHRSHGWYDTKTLFVVQYG